MIFLVFLIKKNEPKNNSKVLEQKILSDDFALTAHLKP